MQIRELQGFILNRKHLLTLEYWELHEAAFILTTAPKNLIAVGIPPFVYERLNRDAVLYVPEHRLNKKSISAKTRKVLSALKTSIENGEIEGLPFNLYLRGCYSGLNLIFHIVSKIVKNEKSMASASVGIFSKLDRTFFLKFAQNFSIGFKSGE